MLMGSIARLEEEELTAIIGVSLVKDQVSYLGLPLIIGRLIVADYLPIIEKSKDRIKDWKCKFLSHASRLELTRSVVSSFVLY